MKRRREVMETGSEMRSAIQELSVVVKVNPGGDHDNAHIPTRPFLLACELLVQILDKIGPTMTVLRQDVDQNIQRLEKLYESDPSSYSSLVEILKKEVSEGSARKSTSCARALVWLTRSLDFAVAVLDRLVKDPRQSMEQVVEESYKITLKPWHRWIASTAYRVAIKLVPERNTFINMLKAGDEDYDGLKVEMQNLISLLVPLLDKIHSNLVKVYLKQRLLEHSRTSFL